ncbi:MAG: hypothetical protein Q4G68_07640 [Planctomycetia bacterium]|nr:hypothetical protein [Planctomycetia bacterium]
MILIVILTMDVFSQEEFLSTRDMESLRTLMAIFDRDGGPEYECFIAARFPERNPARAMLARFHNLCVNPPQEAPAVFGEEAYPDPNIVAEYIDSRLTDPFLMRQFEAAVLKDDSLLAELLAVAELAEVEDHPSQPNELPLFCLQRLYYIPQASGDAAPVRPLTATPSLSPCPQDPTENEIFNPQYEPPVKQESDSTQELAESCVSPSEVTPLKSVSPPSRSARRKSSNHAIAKTDLVSSKSGRKQMTWSSIFTQISCALALVMLAVLLVHGEGRALWNLLTRQDSAETSQIRPEPLANLQGKSEPGPVLSPPELPEFSALTLETGSSQREPGPEATAYSHEVQPSIEIAPDRVEFLSERQLLPERESH